MKYAKVVAVESLKKKQDVSRRGKEADEAGDGEQVSLWSFRPSRVCNPKLATRRDFTLVLRTS